MQRPNNVTPSAGGLWPEGVPNYGMNPPLQLPLNLRTTAVTGAAPKLWSLDSNNAKGSGSDRASLLGTKQWGRESGGAPWGQPSPTEKSPAPNQTLPITSASNLLAAGAFSTADSNPGHMNLASQARANLHFNIADYVLGGPTAADPTALMNESVFNAGMIQDSRKSGNGQQSQIPSLVSYGESKSQNSGGTSRESSPQEEQTTVLRHQQNQQQLSRSGRVSPRSILSATSGASASTDDTLTPSNQRVKDSPKQPDNTDTIAGGSGSGQTSTVESTQPSEHPQISNFTGTGDVEFGQVPASQPIDNVLQQQMSQLNLDYTAQQQSLAVQLAMQQQYILAQQQQLAAMPGVFLPNPYVITTPNASGYTDPATGGQFPIMPQYSYPTWPNVAYPSMIPPHMAQSVASQQQGSTPGSTVQGGRSSQPDSQLSRSESPTMQPATSDASDTSTSLPAPVYPDMLNTFPGQSLNPAMAMSGSGYQMIPAAYYDQSGALIVNNGRFGAPVRFLAPGIPAPMFLNGSQSQTAGTLYPSPSMSGGSTPVPGAAGGYAPLAPHGALSGIGAAGSLGSLGSLGGAMGSHRSTPQRRDSFSDIGKHPSYGGPMSHFYSTFGMSPSGGGMGISAISPSPGPLSGMVGSAHSHHSMSPPPLSSPSGFFGGGNPRMFSAAPGAEARYRNGSMYGSSNVFGNSGSSLFPTKMRPVPNKDMTPVPGRSRLLDDFRNNRFPNPQLRDLSNHIVEFSRDQHGSRFIQQKLERASPQEKQMVFNEIARAAYQLMTDVFGNYVIQKFFEFGSAEQKLALAKCIRGHVLPLALQMYGCRVIQKALECIPPEEQVEIVKELDGHLIKCVKDQNGNHVVQKCIECVSPVHLQFIIDAFKGQVILLSMHPYGCRVMQRILEHCTSEQTGPILEELHQQADTLVTDQYGNYVIQHILEHGRPENKSKIVLGLTGKVLKLSQHKFASNVVEKCVTHSSRMERAILIEEACQDSDALVFMMKDQYANYVVQKMLDVAEAAQRTMLIAKIRPHTAQLRKFTYGKHIIAKLEKYIVKSNAPPSGSGPVALPQNMVPQQVSLPPAITSAVLQPTPP